MVNEQESNLASNFGDARDETYRRAMAAGLECTTLTLGYIEESGPILELQVNFPNGRSKRSIVVPEETAEEFNAIDFENVAIIGPYRAVCFRSEKDLEVLLSEPANTAYVFSQILSLPGIELFRCNRETGEIFEWFETLEELREELGGDPVRVLRRSTGDYGWRLPIADPPGRISVEVSPLSRKYESLVGPTELPSAPMARLTLKISGIEYATHDRMRDRMEEIASSVLFELDLRFNLTISMVHRGDPIPHRPPKIDESDVRPVTFPTTKYSRPATTLYFYGKQTDDTPLLRYLAYYQAIEYFFPKFVHRDTIERVRAELRNPAFDERKDSDAYRLIRVATGGLRTGKLSEARQLATTLSYCLDEELTGDFLDSASQQVQEFLAKKDALRGVPPIRRQAGELINQLSARMYALRCRIVHAKGESDDYVEPLLPFSEEADSLRNDLFLAEFVCQRVIVAGSTDIF